MLNIKKKDKVVVLAGKDKGKGVMQQWDKLEMLNMKTCQ